MKAWLTLYQRSIALGGASEVIARRVQMMGNPWTPATWIEMQQMVTEKMLAASESWWSLYTAPTAGWLTATNRALLPYSKRVSANRKRLRKR